MTRQAAVFQEILETKIILRGNIKTQRSLEFKKKGFGQIGVTTSLIIRKPSAAGLSISKLILHSLLQVIAKSTYLTICCRFIITSESKCLSSSITRKPTFSLSKQLSANIVF